MYSKKHVVLRFVSVLWHIDDFLCVLKLQSALPRTDYTLTLSTHHPCVYGQKYPLNHRLLMNRFKTFWLVPTHYSTANQITIFFKRKGLSCRVKWWGHEHVSITHEISRINGASLVRPHHYNLFSSSNRKVGVILCCYGNY